MSAQIAYYRDKAQQLISLKRGVRASYGFKNPDAYETQDANIDRIVRELYSLPPAAPGQLYGFVTPYQPPMKSDLTGLTPADQMTYLWQLNNSIAPYGTCNVTACAMGLSGYGITGSRGVQYLPEELRAYIEDDNYGDRHLPVDLVKACKWKGVDVELRENYTLHELIDVLSEGRPVISDGWYTPSGHFIMLKAYRNKKFICFDPYGEWFNTGYQVSSTGGNGVAYSENMIISAGISAGGWTDRQNWPSDPFNCRTFAAIVFPKK